MTAPRLNPVTTPPEAVRGLVDRAVRSVRLDVRRHGAALGCAHLDHGGPVYLCAQHPSGGLRCDACMRAHAGRHPEALELRCDGCGVDDHGGWHLFIQEASAALPVKSPSGRRGLLVGTVFLIGMGLCADCWQQEDVA